MPPGEGVGCGVGIGRAGRNLWPGRHCKEAGRPSIRQASHQGGMLTSQSGSERGRGTRKEGERMEKKEGDRAREEGEGRERERGRG